MQILKGILIVIDIIIGLAVILVVMLQHKEDQGVSGTITGAAAHNFLDKNKGRTKEGKMRKWTIILCVVFAVLSIAITSI